MINIPIPSDFWEVSAHQQPTLFDYCCISGKQLYIKKVRNKYRVIAVSWQPTGLKEINYLKPEQTVYETHNWEEAHRIYLKNVKELQINESRNSWPVTIL